MSPDLTLGQIETMALPELRQAWVASFGGEPPKLRTRELMRLALAYRLQACAHGDISGPTRRKMVELARRFAEDRQYTPVAAPVLKLGSSVMKTWRGARHEVRVVEGGFSYLGERFGSLSEVAQRITGAKWNGQVFFGLKARRR
jgi:hypothetical protein